MCARVRACLFWRVTAVCFSARARAPRARLFSAQTPLTPNTPQNNTHTHNQPKNLKDIEAIDSLADAINGYDGGVVLVSHDFRLIDQVAKSIWVCENKAVKPWNSGIREYKALLARKMKKAAAA